MNVLNQKIEYKNFKKTKPTRVTTVTITESVTKTIVNKRYLPIKGMTRDVDGIISTSNKKKTVNEIKILIHNEIFSPPSEGK